MTPQIDASNGCLIFRVNYESLAIIIIIIIITIIIIIIIIIIIAIIINVIIIIIVIILVLCFKKGVKFLPVLSESLVKNEKYTCTNNVFRTQSNI